MVHRCVALKDQADDRGTTGVIAFVAAGWRDAPAENQLTGGLIQKDVTRSPDAKASSFLAILIRDGMNSRE